jgi:AAA family ATP:ADP antiporter
MRRTETPAGREGEEAGTRRVLGGALELRPGELPLLLLSAAYFFFALAAWYVLRPIRDEMGVAGGVDNLAWLFLGTLTATLLAQPVFAALVERWPRRRFIPWTYRFFGLNLVLFFVALRTLGAGDASAQVWIGRTFFVWSGVFNLFVVSVFWGFMADVFEPGQGRRLFGVIAAGGTLGGLLGGAVTASVVEAVGAAPLLLLAAVLLEAAVRCEAVLGRRAARRDRAQEVAERRPIGGGVLAGITHVARSPYLLGICFFLLLYTVSSTFLYFLQAQIVSDAVSDPGARTALFARIDVWVNGLTLLLQVGLTGRLLSRLGVGGTLALLPLLSLAGFAALAAAPALAALVVFQVARRTTNFALSRPARENLFIPLPREDKYKAKSFLDTFVYRAGDQAGAWTHTGLAAAGLGVAGISAAALPICAAWLVLALWLGRRYLRLLAHRHRTDDPPRLPEEARLLETPSP